MTSDLYTYGSKRMSASTLRHRIKRGSRTQKRRRNRLAPGLASLCLLALLLFAPRAKATTWVDLHGVPDQRLIGIHLGSSESRVGVVRNPGGSVEILFTKSGQGQDQEGARFIPSYVVATDTGLVSGEVARGHGGLNLFKALLDVKTYLAEDHANNPRIRLPEYIHSYTLQENKQVLQIDYNGTCHSLTPEEILTPLLSELRDIAISHIGPGKLGAVVATPFPYGETTTAELERAGESIDLPIIRHGQETSMTLRALGVNDLSHGEERYILIYDLAEDFQTLTVKIIEIDNDIMDLLSTYQAHIKPNDVEETHIAKLAHENFDWNTSHISKREVLDILESRLQDITIDSILMALKRAGLKPKQITDLVFMPSTHLFGNIQRYWFRWFRSKGNEDLKIANANSLNLAPVHGATLVAYWLQDDDLAGWVPCSGEHFRPPIRIGTSTGTVEDVLRGPYRVPAFARESFRASCSEVNGNKTTVQVYFLDIPSLDYHERQELGEEYIHDVLARDVLLGEFNIDTPCEDTNNPPLLDICILMRRDSSLKVEVLNARTQNAEILTFPHLDFRCGSDNRYSDGERFNYTHYPDPTLSLEREYEMDVKRFMGSSGWEEPADAFEADVL
ncbi:hypothetical protein BDW69DRAFT_168268 [Aspergillus filifer]